MNQLQEQSLSRVFKHFQDPEITLVIFTAFRDEIKYEDNIKKNKTFGAILKKNHFGYFYVDGHFPENLGTPKEVDAKEDSIFAIASNNQSQNLINLAHTLANQANQDSIIVKDSSGIYFLDKNKNKDYLPKGKISINKLGKYYTKLRNKGSKSGSFVFENEILPRNSISSFAELFKQKN